MVMVPNAFLWLRVRTARKLQEKREIAVGMADDHREHLLVYLFAMLLPFYALDLRTWRDLGAALAALGFIIFLFWHLNLHYMNLIFAVRGYPRVHGLSDGGGQPAQRQGNSGAYYPSRDRISRRAAGRLPPE